MARLCMEANFELEDDVQKALEKAHEAEESPAGKEVLRQIIENSGIARGERMPMCQDTGLAVIFAEVGQDLHIAGGGFEDAINAGVRKGYTDGYLRKSVLADPVKGGNTGDNTPAVIHTTIVPGEELKLWVVPKGGGSENMSRIAMMKPADGIEGIKKFVVENVKSASGNPCPPIIVGVGIGGTFERCAQLAKKALLREIGSHASRRALCRAGKGTAQDGKRSRRRPDGARRPDDGARRPHRGGPEAYRLVPGIDEHQLSRR